MVVKRFFLFNSLFCFVKTMVVYLKSSKSCQRHFSASSLLSYMSSKPDMLYVIHLAVAKSK